MKKQMLILSTLLCGHFFLSQTVYFKYDEAGNQRYRGPEIDGKKSNNNQDQIENITPKIFSEKDFWNEIRIYPVPVKDILTIDWTEKANDMISEVSMFQHSNLSWVFQQKNIRSINRNIKIDMRNKYLGVYVITFILKDGKRLTKNIIKN